MAAGGGGGTPWTGQRNGGMAEEEVKILKCLAAQSYYRSDSHLQASTRLRIAPISRDPHPSANGFKAVKLEKQQIQKIHVELLNASQL